MTTLAIQTLLDEHTAAISGMPTTLVAENGIVNPKNGASWYRTTNLPALSNIETLGVNGTDEINGVYVIDLFYPTQTGFTIGLTQAQLVLNAFKCGTILTDGTTKVYIWIPSVIARKKFENWYQIPIQVRWSCYVSR